MAIKLKMLSDAQNKMLELTRIAPTLLKRVLAGRTLINILLQKEVIYKEKIKALNKQLKQAKKK